MSEFQPEVGELVAQTESLTALAETLLRATERRGIIDTGSALLSQILGAPDGAPGRVGDGTITLLRNDLDTLRDGFDSAARRSAHFSYFTGLLLALPFVVALAAGVAALFSTVGIENYSSSTLASVAIAGAVGAVASVMARMSSGDFRLVHVAKWAAAGRGESR